MALGCVTGLAYAESVEVPAGNELDASIVNYRRVTPVIATSGVLREGAIARLKAHRFSTIVDLRTPPEGTRAEQVAAQAAGLRYFNIPISDGAPTLEQLREFARLVEDSANHPLLVHCASANRVGAMWSLYRAFRGVPRETALVEGRAIGMTDGRERQLRQAWCTQPGLLPEAELSC
ncbi:MAG: fused DSP-PTPase phosphatase/NAD kinase-like protein [Burkholderiales bacterium]